ncbi:MAG TPA: type I methionyl aminopeptidase [Eubacteriales bacterium]|nr:type I methionyl aminopeptidase [Clostridia bacterium]HRV73427.1 type I methionyl aminopeptidase [Eubacteriales bacterium]
MIELKTEAEIQKMKAAGKVVEDTLKLLERSVREGITTEELDRISEDYIRSCGAVPSFLNYEGYPKSICVSINDQVVHGIPGKRRIKDGDIVSCDVGAYLDGFHGDAARTFIVGNVPDEVKELVKVTRECFFEALKYCREGYRISDISIAVQKHAESHGYGVVRELIGHGVGRHMHEQPDVPNYYSPHSRQRLQAGMTIAIEPMINLGTAAVWQLEDGWTVVTRDGKPSAHYENSVAVTSGDPILLTLTEDVHEG